MGEGKKPDDYHLDFKVQWKSDIDSMVLRDRNHPSVIMWSIGNEIEERARSDGMRIAKELSTRVRESWTPLGQSLWPSLIGPARIVTGRKGIRPGVRADLDVGGYNYMPDKYEPDHARHTDRPMVCTESYPEGVVRLLERWSKKHPYVIGDFVWTGMDYLGESGSAPLASRPK